MAPAHSASSPDLGAPSLATATRKRYDSTLPPGTRRGPAPGPAMGPTGRSGPGLRRPGALRGSGAEGQGEGGAGQDGRDVGEGLRPS